MKRIEIHPVNPQPRLIRQVAEQFQTGALMPAMCWPVTWKTARPLTGCVSCAASMRSTC